MPNLLVTLKPILDLLIVITGVSVAFLLNGWSENNKEAAEREKVMRSLQQEINEIVYYFPSMAKYQENNSKKWDSLLNLNIVGEFNQYYYLQPQYNYSVIEYAIATRNSDIVDFRLHEQLLKLYKRIKMLEQAEIHMTNIALQYQAAETKESHAKQNLFLFERFIGFSKNRASIMKDINELADETQKMISIK
jgi:hypothetical protein